MRVATLALALLTAGCLGVGEAVEPLVDSEGPSSMEDSSIVLEEPEESVEPVDAEVCAELGAIVENATIAPGENATVRATFLNCGADPLDRRTTCVGNKWMATFEHDNHTWYPQREGAARATMLCATAIGRWQLDANESMEMAWRWNGTLTDCRANVTCVTRAAPPGDYDVVVTVQGMRPDFDPDALSEWSTIARVTVT